MAELHTLETDLARADEARFLLENESLKNAFLTVEQNYMDAWKATGNNDAQARERLWMAFDIITRVQEQLQSVIGGGTLAQRELNDIAGKKKLFGVY